MSTPEYFNRGAWVTVTGTLRTYTDPEALTGPVAVIGTIIAISADPQKQVTRLPTTAGDVGGVIVQGDSLVVGVQFRPEFTSAAEKTFNEGLDIQIGTVIDIQGCVEIPSIQDSYKFLVTSVPFSASLAGPAVYQFGCERHNGTDFAKIAL